MPALAEDECRVAVRAIGLNYADVFCVLGLYDAANKVLEDDPTGGPFVPGLEFAGEVVEVGGAVKTHRVGDRVYGFSRFGSYTTSLASRESLLKPIPESWSYAEAAALLVQGLTAWHGLVELGAAKKGSRVLVHSAAGGVGCAALEICKNLGCDAVGVVGSDAKVPFLRERFPACTPLVRGPEGGYAQQLDEVGGEYDVVLESLGGRYLTAALDRIAPMGRMVHFGATHAYGGSRVDGLFKWLKLVPNYLRRPLIDPGKIVPKNIGIFGFNLIWLTEREEELTRELDDMLGRGGLASRAPAVGKEFPFAELPAALDWLRSGQSTGKVVVTVSAEDAAGRVDA
jgi:NADPH:quinone reductase-like Zn-dependent oxidoreductase